MHIIDYGRSSALIQIVYFENRRLVHKLALVVRGRIEVMMNQSMVTHGNRLQGDNGT